MELIQKIIRKIREGRLRELWSELLLIYQYGLHYKWAIAWYMLLGVFGTGISLGGSLLSKYIIDAVTGYDNSAIIPALVFYLLMQLSTIGINAWTGYVSARIEIKVDQEIRADVYDKIMNAQWEAMSEYHSGDLLNRVDNDVSSVSTSVIGWVPDFFKRALHFAGALFVILYYDKTLAILALLSAPVTLMMSRKIMHRMRTYNKRLREVSSEVMTFNEESFKNIQMIKSFGLSELYGRKLRDVQERQRSMKLEYSLFNAKTNAIMNLTGTIVTVICFAWGVYRLWEGHITYGTMMLFLQMASSLSGSFGAMVYMIPRAISAATAAGRIMAVTELPKEKMEQEEDVQILKESGKGIVVEAKQMNFRYSTGKVVFEEADFIAKPGEIVALVGASGTGKTTMLRILLGIVSVNRGSMMVKNRKGTIQIPVNAATRSLFAYVPQENTMFAGTVAENLRLMKQDATDEELNEALKMACAYEFVHSIPTGLNSKIKENGGGFSQGQIQRLSIARALLSDAPILLLDEATSALDIETERRVLENIMGSNMRRTCIVTTHRPSVLDYCHRVYRITPGKMEIVAEK